MVQSQFQLKSYEELTPLLQVIDARFLKLSGGPSEPTRDCHSPLYPRGFVILLSIRLLGETICHALPSVFGVYTINKSSMGYESDQDMAIYKRKIGLTLGYSNKFLETLLGIADGVHVRLL